MVNYPQLNNNEHPRREERLIPPPCFICTHSRERTVLALRGFFISIVIPHQGKLQANRKETTNMAQRIRSRQIFSTVDIASTGVFTNSGSTIVGASGTALTNWLAGTVSACFLSMATVASAAGSAAVTGASPGDIVVSLLSACTTGSAFITSASVTAANKVEFKTYNAGGGTAAASTVLLQYFIVRPG
jgi:hypothetical protein